MQMHTWRSSKVLNCAVVLVVASYVCAFAELKLLEFIGVDPMRSLVLVRPLVAITVHRRDRDLWALGST
jgi:energy-converting hydrogenase Eha subunit E